jgi:hypothetical protein
VRGTTSSKDKVIDLHQPFLVLLQTTQSDHSLGCHQSCSKVERFVHALGFVQHFHNVIVLNTIRQLYTHLFFSDFFNLMKLDLVIQRQFYNLFVLDVVVVASVVLKNSCVTSYYLKFVICTGALVRKGFC